MNRFGSMRRVTSHGTLNEYLRGSCIAFTSHAPSLIVRSAIAQMINASKNDFCLETLSEAENYNRWVYELMRPYLGSRILELGAGIGNHTPNLLMENRAVVAIDVSPELIRRHRARVPANSRLEVVCTSIQALAGRADQVETYDCIVSSNVLEHIPDGMDRDVARAMHRLLRPGGHAVHWVPACPAIYGSLDKMFGHHRRYTPVTASALFQEAGLQVISCEYWNILGFFGWWLSGRILKAGSLSRSSALAFDRFVVPIIRRIEPLVRRPFGQSLLVVAQKPRSTVARRSHP